jgi:hypothetical protein
MSGCHMTPPPYPYPMEAMLYQNYFICDDPTYVKWPQ